jgi:glycosyltransferase involved in cell wall biosynthesis
MDPRHLAGPRVLSLVSCDLCGKREPPPHDEHVGTGCDLWRTFAPYAELQRQGYGAGVGLHQYGAEWEWKDARTLGEYADTIGLAYHAVVFPRLSWTSRDMPYARQFVDRLHAAGIALIYEVDDDLYSQSINWRLQRTVLPDESLESLERKRLDRLAALRLCDGVTVSSRRLATVVRTLVDVPVVVVPNAIDARWWRAVVRRAPRIVPGLTIGWAGGARPDDDLEPVFWAWGQIAQTHPDVTFVIAGHQPEAVATYVPNHRVMRLEWLPPAQYPAAYAQIDIGCAAVTDHPFNRCKTPIKVWEYALGGAPCVATPTLYGQAIDNGVDGLLAETPDEWLSALKRLVESKALRRSLRAAQLHRIRANHDLARECWRWPAAWSQIVADFRERRRYASLGLYVPGRSA